MIEIQTTKASVDQFFSPEMQQIWDNMKTNLETQQSMTCTTGDIFILQHSIAMMMQIIADQSSFISELEKAGLIKINYHQPTPEKAN